MTEEFQVGVITQPHGIKGEVKVFPTTDAPVRFKRLKSAWIDTGKQRIPVEIASVKFFKQFVILKFKEFNDINEVECLRTAKIMVDRAHAVPLSKNEYYVADLIGISVYTEDGSLLGTLTDVISTGANDVYDVKMEDGRSVLLPAISECILEVDPAAGMMKIHLMDGLID